MDWLEQFIKKPQVILLDDPLSAVDRHVSKKIWNECILDILRWVFTRKYGILVPLCPVTVKNMLKTIASDTTVLIATHQINYLNEADYIYHLKDGKLIEQGGPEILKNQTEIGQAYERFIASAASSQQKPSKSEGDEESEKTSEKVNEES